MATVEKSGLANVDRFWRDVRKGPRGEHLHVSLLGLRTFGTAELHSRLEEGLSYEALERLRKVLDLPLLESRNCCRSRPGPSPVGRKPSGFCRMSRIGWCGFPDWSALPFSSLKETSQAPGAG